MDLSGDVTAVVAAAAGASIAWASNAWAVRRGRNDAQANQRRDAYSALILTLDHLERVWSAPETIEDEHKVKKMGEVTGEALRRIQQAYVTVLLTGSKKARTAANEARAAAWALNDALQRPHPGYLIPPIGEAYDRLVAASKAFVEVAHPLCQADVRHPPLENY